MSKRQGDISQATYQREIIKGGPISLMKGIYGQYEDSEYILEYDCLEVAKVIDEVFDTLTPRESFVIKGRFALNPGDSTPMTLEQVSHHVPRVDGGKGPVSRERIRQIEAKAFRKLRHPNRRLKLDELLVRRNTHPEA